MRANSTANQREHIAVIHEGPGRDMLPFLRAHIDLLPCEATLIHGLPPHLGDQPILSQQKPSRAWRKIKRSLMHRPWEWEFTASYLRAFRILRPTVVLAEWGPVAVRVLEACRIHRLPLIAHFHGYDASVHSVLRAYADGYRTLFGEAAAVVAFSRTMERLLVNLGAPAEKVSYNPYGVDCRQFGD